MIRHDTQGNELTVNCTPAVKQYIGMMGGVYVSDKMARLDKSRKTYRWYSRIDGKMVMLSIVNSFLIYQAHTGKKIELRTFVICVTHQLIGNKRFRQREAGRPKTLPSAHTRLVEIAHVCVVCTEKQALFIQFIRLYTCIVLSFQRCKL